MSSTRVLALGCGSALPPVHRYPSGSRQCCSVPSRRGRADCEHGSHFVPQCPHNSLRAGTCGLDSSLTPFTPGSAGRKVYEARVNGVFQTRRSKELRAIVEVKPFLRLRKKDAIWMQEAGQVAAWISSYPPDIEKLRRENRKVR